MLDTARQLARKLWSEVDAAVSPYPKCVVAVPESVKRTAFFPGGLGLWLDRDMPITSAMPQVLIVGQDFNTVGTYKRIEKLGTQTWRNLSPILSHAGIPREARIFTNFHMGLREAGRETGKFPGARL